MDSNDTSSAGAELYVLGHVPAELRRDLEPDDVVTVVVPMIQWRPPVKEISRPVSSSLPLRSQNSASAPTTVLFRRSPALASTSKTVGECVPPTNRAAEFVVCSVLAEYHDRGNHELEGAAVHRLGGLQNADVLKPRPAARSIEPEPRQERFGKTSCYNILLNRVRSRAGRPHRIN